MAMLCRVKMTSRCIRLKTAVETEIISAGSFLKRRTRRSPCPTLTPVNGSNTGYYGAFATKFDECE